MVKHLREENRILRGKLPKCITVIPRESNRFVKLGSKLGTAIRALISIVAPRTFARWVSDTLLSHAAQPMSGQRRADRPRSGKWESLPPPEDRLFAWNVSGAQTVRRVGGGLAWR